MDTRVTQHNPSSTMKNFNLNRRRFLGSAVSAGAFAIVLECVPAELSALITKRLAIPTIGIGSGPHCDAEIQVIADTLGWFSDFVPKHARQFAKLAEPAAAALKEYAEAVTAGTFPTQKESVSVSEDVIRAVEENLAKGADD